MCLYTLNDVTLLSAKQDGYSSNSFFFFIKTCHVSTFTLILGCKPHLLLQTYVSRRSSPEAGWENLLLLLPLPPSESERKRNSSFKKNNENTTDVVPFARHPIINYKKQTGISPTHVPQARMMPARKGGDYCGTSWMHKQTCAELFHLPKLWLLCCHVHNKQPELSTCNWRWRCGKDSLELGKAPTSSLPQKHLLCWI